jgi:hypothetical protein
MTQRNAIRDAIATLAPSDDAIVMVSDCDEIPSPDLVLAVRQAGLTDGTVWTCGQRFCYYDLNTSAGYTWNGTRVARWADVRALSPHVIRYGLANGDGLYPRHIRASKGGWHLSYFGGAPAVQAKMRAFLHQELVNDASLAAVASRIAAGTDLYGRSIPGHQFVRAPTTDVPPPVLADPDRWRHLYHPEYAP